MKIIYTYFLIIIPFFSFSQENLTLENALKIGLKQNFDIQLSKKNLEISKLNNNLKLRRPLPTLNLSARQEQAVSDQSKNPTSFIQEILKSESININQSELDITKWIWN